jgi:hypothetical protein
MMEQPLTRFPKVTADIILQSVKTVSVHGLVDVIISQIELLMNNTLPDKEHLQYHLLL